MIKTDCLSLIFPEGSWGNHRRPCPGTWVCTSLLPQAGDTDCPCILPDSGPAPHQSGLAGGGWGLRPTRLWRGQS